MSKKELIMLFDDFINEYALNENFKIFIEENGYSEEDYDKAIEQCFRIDYD